MNEMFLYDEKIRLCFVLYGGGSIYTVETGNIGFQLFQSFRVTTSTLSYIYGQIWIQITSHFFFFLHSCLIVIRIEVFYHIFLCAFPS